MPVQSLPSDAPAPFGASGANHARGLVPDPGANAGTAKYLREDSSWQTPVLAGLAGGANGQVLKTIAGLAAWVDDVADLRFTLSGGGVAIVTGQSNYTPVDFAGTILQAQILVDVSATVSVSLRKCTYAQYDAGATHPAAGDNITASSPIAVAAALKAQNLALTGWTVNFNTGDIFAVSVDANDNATVIVISLKVKKTS